MAADILRMDQGLLIRNPSMTEKEFSDHWYYKHSQLVIPFFLHSGMGHYEQIHGPLTPINETSTANITSIPDNKTLDLSTFSGACALPPQGVLENIKLPKWKQAYYDEVIKVDERRFLVAEALDHIVRIAPQSVKGEKRVVIGDGKALIEVSDEVWAVWREYEARGKEEEKEDKGK